MRNQDGTPGGKDLYIKYPGANLTHVDVQTIESRHGWLTDSCLAFWSAYLTKEIISRHKRCNVVILEPSVTSMLMGPAFETSKESRELLPQITEKTTHVFIVVNDYYRPSESPVGTSQDDYLGSHWSLLLISLVDGLAFHYDSLNSSNDQAAQDITTKMSIFTETPLNYVDIQDAPQQQNGSDCGVHVCMTMKHLLIDKLLRAHVGMQISMNVLEHDIDPSHARGHIMAVINARRDSLD